MITASAFLIGFFLLVGAALCRHPIYGLYAYLATFYIHPPSRWWAQSLPDLRWAFLSAGVTLVAIVIHRSKLDMSRPSANTVPAIVLLLFIAYLWIQTTWALDADAHLQATIQFTKYAFVAYFLYRLADTPERIRDILLVHVVGCAVLGIMAHQSNNFVDGRLNGVGGPGIDDANSLGMFLGTGAVVTAAMVLMQRGWRQIVAIASAPFILNGIILASSRGAFLGVCAGGVVLMLLKPAKYRRVFWLLAVVGLIGAVSLMDQRFIDRMHTITSAVEGSEEIDSSAQSRYELKNAQLKMFAEYPFGAGHKGTAFLSARFLDRRWLVGNPGGEGSEAARSSHNTFLTALVEQGVLGAVLYVALATWGVLTVRRLKRAQRSDSDPLLAMLGAASCGALATVFVAGLFTDYLMAEVQVWMFALLLALLQIRQARLQPSPTAQPTVVVQAVVPGAGVSAQRMHPTAVAKGVPRPLPQSPVNRRER